MKGGIRGTYLLFPFRFRTWSADLSTAHLQERCDEPPATEHIFQDPRAQDWQQKYSRHASGSPAERWQAPGHCPLPSFYRSALEQMVQRSPGGTLRALRARSHGQKEEQPDPVYSYPF